VIPALLGEELVALARSMTRKAPLPARRLAAERREDSPPSSHGPRPATGSSPPRASARDRESRAARFGAMPSAAPRNRLGGPGTPGPPRWTGSVGPAALRQCRAPQSLRVAWKSDVAPGSPTPLGGADDPRRGFCRRPTGASASAKQTQTRRRTHGASASREWRRTLTAPLRRGSQRAIPGERKSPPRCTRSTFFGRPKPGGKTDQTGLAPDRPQRHRGPT
jgi:hypothetical protein